MTVSQMLYKMQKNGKYFFCSKGWSTFLYIAQHLTDYMMCIDFPTFCLIVTIRQVDDPCFQCLAQFFFHQGQIKHVWTCQRAGQYLSASFGYVHRIYAYMCGIPIPAPLQLVRCNFANVNIFECSLQFLNPTLFAKKTNIMGLTGSRKRNSAWHFMLWFYARTKGLKECSWILFIMIHGFMSTAANTNIKPDAPISCFTIIYLWMNILQLH